MGDVGKPERIVEDEPITFPDAEPLTAPVPVTPAPTPQRTPTEAPAGESPTPGERREGPEPPRAR